MIYASHRRGWAGPLAATVAVVVLVRTFVVQVYGITTPSMGGTPGRRHVGHTLGNMVSRLARRSRGQPLTMREIALHPPMLSLPRMPRLALLGFVLLFATPGCQGDRVEPAAATPLLAEVVADGDYLDSPRRIAVVGRRLVVLDRSAPMIHVLRLPDGERIGSVGRRGEGPGEFRSTHEIQTDGTSPDAFWVFDGTLSRVTRLRFDNAAPVPVADEVVNLHGEGGLHFQAVWISDSALAATGIYPGHPQSRLLRLDRDGRAVSGIGTFPQHPNAAGIPPTVLHHAYEGRMAVRPDRSRFAFGTRHADALEIYRADGSLARRVAGSTGFLPVFDTNVRAEGASMATGDDLRVGYLDFAATQDHLFALFSGDTRKEARARTYFGKQVHVFDWSGERLTTLALDERAIAIAVDTAEGHLYAVRHDPVPSVVRYRLPDLP